jgi:hypothetical protein
MFSVFVMSYQENLPVCNRDVQLKEYKPKLIKEVCIPAGFWISELRTDTQDIDIDGDGLGDFIFDWNKPKLQDGDTLFITVYKQNVDSTYSFLKTFKNLLPVYLKSYDFPAKNNVLAAKIFECYADGYPLVDLTFQKGSILLNIRIDAASGYFLEYAYIKEKKNWFLTNYKEWIDMPGGRKFQDREVSKEPESIDDFSYQKYLCADLFPHTN